MRFTRTVAVAAAILLAIGGLSYAGCCGGGGATSMAATTYGGTSCYSGSYASVATASGPFARMKARRAARQAALAGTFSMLPTYGTTFSYTPVYSDRVYRYATPQTSATGGECINGFCPAPDTPSIVPETKPLASLVPDPVPVQVASVDYKLWDDTPSIVPDTSPPREQLVAMNDGPSTGRLY